MKIFSQLAGLSAAATLVLQLGTFVEASPFFAGSSTSIHGNDADTTQQCQGLRFSFPSATGLSFEEQSKHVVAWQAPLTLDKVTLTLVNDDDDSTTSSSINIGNFDANSGATDELPLDLKGQQPGKYHYHIQATGSAGDCNVDSVTFTINQQQQTSSSSSSSSSTSSSNATQGDQHDNNDGTFDNLVQNVKSQTTSANDHTDAQLDDLVSNLKQTQNAHANDQAFDDLVSNMPKSSSTATNTDQTLDDLVNNLKQTETQHANSNDQVLDGIVNDIKGTQTQHSNDQVLDQLVNDLKGSESQHTDDDKVLDGIVNDLKSSESQHSNDQDLDNLISNLPSNNNGDDMDSLVNDIKSSTTTTAKQSGHQDAALNEELDSLAANDDTKLDTLIGDISKSTAAHQHEDDTSTDPDWNAMINDLNSLPSHANQNEPKETTQTQGLDQVIDDLAKSIKDNKDKTHSDAAVATDPSKLESFKSFIDDLDQDHTKYIDKNKDSESKQVSHKNDAKVEDSHANEWFTNSDLRTKINNVKRAFKRSLVKRGENNYFTNEDRRSTHANDAAAVTPEENVAPRPIWSTNGGFFSNDDQRTNANSGNDIHNDAEWAGDDTTTATGPAPATSRPVWATNDGFFSNDDQRTNVDAGEHNDAEWAEDDAATGTTDPSRPVWATNGGFFTNDDQRANVNSGDVHNDAEWAEDDVAAVAEEDGVWHMDEIVDSPEWNVDDADTVLDHHQNSIWESVEQSDEPVYVEAPNHHHNDIEWNVPTTTAEEAPNHHHNDIEWNVNDNTAADEPVVDHTNFVHWDSEADDIEVENDDDDHVNAAIEGEWMDDDDHTNAGGDDDLEWAQDSIEDMEDDETTSHDNGEWQTDEHANDDALTDDNNSRWSLNEDITKWSTNTFDENGNDLSSVSNHANAAADDSNPEWLSSEHANDDHEDDATSWNVNDGPSEWIVDNGEDSSHGNDGGAVPLDQAHDNDATLTSQWLTSEHANDDEPATNNNWNVNEASSGWSVNEASSEWNVNEASSGWSVNEDPTDWTTSEQHVDANEWNVNEASSGWSVNEDPADWTTSEQHVDANEWNVNEATGDWNTDPAGESKPVSSHSNAASSPEWLTDESVHSNDVNW